MTPEYASSVHWMRMVKALSYSRELSEDPWAFAVDIQFLRGQGLTDNDFRWLVCRGYVDHAADVTPLGEDVRQFRRTGRLRFCRRTCFVLTAAGAAAAESYRDGVEAPPRAETSGVVLALDEGPLWDAPRQELRYGGVLVKVFKVPAWNQETILAAFQEEGWPPDR